MQKTMRERRIEMGQTQEDMAKIIGISLHYYAKLERGDRQNPSSEVLRLLEAAFGLPTAELLGWYSNARPAL